MDKSTRTQNAARDAGQELQVISVNDGWSAPGYRDPQIEFVTESGNFLFRLTPEAFVQLHDILCEEQDVIDRTGNQPIDMDRYPRQTRHIVALRRPFGK